MTQERVATIHDVASRAGVAVSSVSRVLSNHPDVSDAMRAKVERAVRELGYQPDPVAQSLRSGTTRAVGLIVRDYSTPFFAEVITGIESVLSLADYSLLVTSSGRDVSQEIERIRMLRQRRVDAILLATVSDKSVATREAIKSFGRPVVLLDREFNRLSTGRVLLDHASGVKAATKDLLSLGHKQIAFITGTQDVRPTRERLRGFMEAYEEAGIDNSSATIIAEVFSASFARSQTIKLLSDKRSRRPTALLAGGVQTTSGILEALNELSMLPGRDVSLVVCDDLPWLRVSRPSISVVTRDPLEMGSVSATMVLEMLGGTPAYTVTLPTQYAARDSTQPLSS